MSIPPHLRSADPATQRFLFSRASSPAPSVESELDVRRPIVRAPTPYCKVNVPDIPSRSPSASPARFKRAPSPYPKMLVCPMSTPDKENEDPSAGTPNLSHKLQPIRGRDAILTPLRSRFSFDNISVEEQDGEYARLILEDAPEEYDYACDGTTAPPNTPLSATF